MNASDFIGDKEAAKLFGLSQNTLRHHCMKSFKCPAAPLEPQPHIRAVEHAHMLERSHCMMITRAQLMAVLDASEPWHWKATDWRKLSNGRIVRFVKWGWKM